MLLLSIKGLAQKEDLYLPVRCLFSCVLLLALNLFATSVQNEVLYTGNEAISAQKVFVHFISHKHKSSLYYFGHYLQNVEHT